MIRTKGQIEAEISEAVTRFEHVCETRRFGKKRGRVVQHHHYETGKSGAGFYGRNSRKGVKDRRL